MAGELTEEQLAAAKALLADPAALLERLDAEEQRRDLRAFARAAWSQFDQAPLKWGWYNDAICEHLAEVARGGIRRLVINQPPRTAKSNFCSIMFPAWVWATRPERQFIVATYGADLAAKMAVKCRMLVQSPWYGRFRGQGEEGWALRGDFNQREHFINTRHGHYYAAGMGGSVLGHGCDFMIVDDPLNSEQRHSKAARDAANDFMTAIAPTRLNDPATGAIILVMQRLHEDDPTGYVSRGGGYEICRLPSEFELEHRSVTYHWVGGAREEFWRDPRTEEGELLAPDRFPRAFLEEKKRTGEMSPDDYQGQHQQRPTRRDGEIFKRGDWRFWSRVATDKPGARPRGCSDLAPLTLPKLDKVIVSVDATFKQTQKGSYVAMHVWGRRGADRFLLERKHGRWGFTQTCAELVELCARWPQARRRIIEEKANGAAIIDQLRHKVTGLAPYSLPEGDKEARALAWQPMHQAGNLYLPEGAAWLEHVVSEFGAFPKAGRDLGDDDVDAWAQAMDELKDAADGSAASWARMAGYTP